MDYYAIIAKHSSKCLDVEGESQEPGANVWQWAYHGGDNQLWKLVPVSDGYYKIIAKNSGKCLDVAGESLESGANVMQWDCHGGDNQLWKLVPVSDGYHKIIAKHSGKCLDVAGESLESGANVTQYDYHAGGNQHWKFVTAGNSSISGYITGKRQFVKEVGLRHIDNPTFNLNASVDANGKFAFNSLSDGRYAVAPIAGGKFDLKAEPPRALVICQGSKPCYVKFEIKEYIEG